MESQKSKQTDFSITQEPEVLHYQDPHPKTSQQAIVDNVSVLQGCAVKHRTVGEILQQREKLGAVADFFLQNAKLGLCECGCE